MFKNDDIGMYKFHYISDTIYMKASKNKTETKKLFKMYHLYITKLNKQKGP